MINRYGKINEALDSLKTAINLKLGHDVGMEHKCVDKENLVWEIVIWSKKHQVRQVITISSADVGQEQVTLDEDMNFVQDKGKDIKEAIANIIANNLKSF